MLSFSGVIYIFLILDYYYQWQLSQLSNLIPRILQYLFIKYVNRYNNYDNLIIKLFLLRQKLYNPCFILIVYNKNSNTLIMTALSHQRNVKQLNNIIESYEKKLDQKVNDMFKHIINQPKNINDIGLPIINNKKISQYRPAKQFRSSKSKHRAQSIASKSFVINSDFNSSIENTQAEYLFKTFKSINEKNSSQKKPEGDNLQINQLGTRSIGTKAYMKPKLIRKKPEILSKQMRWDPFYQKNAIKAQQLSQGMLSLVQRGKIGRNIDIITAFQKGRPILQTHQAIFHHIEQKFTNTDVIQAQTSPEKSTSTMKRQLYKNTNAQNYRTQNNQAVTIDDGNVRYNNQQNSWAITMPEDPSIKTYESKQNKSNINFMEQKIQIYCIYFLHFKLIQNDIYKTMRKQPSFSEEWSKILEIIREIQKFLKKYNIEIIYANGNKILDYVRRHQSLTKIKVTDIKQFFIKANSTFYSIKSIENKQVKKKIAVNIISSAMAFNVIRKKYINILKRKRYEKKIKQWIKNGFIIKQYRRKLEKSKQQVLKKFQQLQRNFRVNYSSIQQKKHYQIHIANRRFMKNFKYYQQYCNTEITRLFNLENNNTNIIYVSPFELNVQTINYYFKIMELEDIENYNERVTFLELEDITSSIKLPESVNCSQKLYFNSKALRKLKKKVDGVPAYFVTNYPTQVDINLAVYLNIPIYSGQFNKINPLRSALNSQRLLCQSIEPTPSLVVQPKAMNVYQFSNTLMKYCQLNKKFKKYIIKINNYHFSSGLALISYPFIGLPEMYKNAVLVQPYYFKSIQKYFSQLTRYGGVVQRYEQGMKTIAVCAKITPDQQHIIMGTFQRISSGFVNIGYLFPQKCIPHKMLVQKSRQVFNKLASLGHIGYVQVTIVVTAQQNIYLEEIELYSTRITNSLYYFKFLAGGYLNHSGQFMTKVLPQGEQVYDQAISPMQSRSYCYIPIMLHFGLSEKQTNSFFQLCRIGGVSFDLENKFGTTFIILGTLKDTVGIITTAKDRKGMIKLVLKSAQFLIKQNSHNISSQMLKEKQERMRQRLNINLIKERLEQL